MYQFIHYFCFVDKCILIKDKILSRLRAQPRSEYSDPKIILQTRLRSLVAEFPHAIIKMLLDVSVIKQQSLLHS